MLKKYLDTVFYFFSFSLVFFLLIFSTNYKILSYLSIILIISIDILMYIVGDYERNIIKQKQSADICLNELKKTKRLY